MGPRNPKNHQTSNRWIPGAVVILLAAVTGCEPVAILDHPLSDEKTSRADKELLGYWKQIDLDDAADAHPVPVTIGLSKTNPRLHEAVALELEDGAKVKVHRFKIHTTTQAVDGSRTSLRLITIAARDLDETQRKAKGYLLLRYEIQAGQRLKIFLINSLAIAKAIEENSLVGVVRRTKPSADGKKPITKYQEIRITASPEQLRAFLKKTGTACFEKKQALEFQKIVTD
jgi:hypothetical protein